MEKKKTKKKATKAIPEMLSKEEWLKKFFGKIKGFGDGMEFQRKMRQGNG